MPAVQTDILEYPSTFLELPEPETVSASRYLVEVPGEVDEIWKTIISDITRTYWILDTDPESRLVSFVEIEGLKGGEIVEFPMVALFEPGEEGKTVIYVSSLQTDWVNLSDKKLQDYQSRQPQRIRQFLLRIEGELSPDRRWPWLSLE
jgi:hypothetical protein